MSALSGLLTPDEADAAAAALATLPADRAADALAVLEEYDRRDAQRLFDHLFPDETHSWRGQTYHARDLYPRHLAAIAATERYREVGVMSANRVGKTLLGCYCLAVWLTGRYPDWWTGRRFPGPIQAWAAGKTTETTRDIVQFTLLGDVLAGRRGPNGERKRFSGSGTVPGEAIGSVSWRQGVADLADTVRVKHTSGRWSSLGLKSYEQGRGSFEGTARHVILLDEEPPPDVYGECLVRTATTDGLVLTTFTPLEGLSEVAMMFVEGTAAPE